ncbi:MAG TPA: hypothetical protein VNW68_07105 [Candidatus Limnocylindria bacterium]|nr:hypothetical protein [Candidatus Limnocylindria bacterium]
MTKLLITCTICGRSLGDNIDDQPDWPTGPLCGECYQANQIDDELMLAGELGDVEDFG